MFRAQATTPYDTAIAKATDENLTSEDWGAIMEVCDRVAGDDNGAKEAVQALIRRLAHRNANVQLYTLEVANALSQNCGKPMHRELASRAFTEALLKLANERNTHNQVKAKILERTKEWSDMFKDDADLGIMYDAYYRLKQTNPQLQPPSAPQKNSLTDIDRQKEEEELQIALKLSLQEEERKKQQTPAGPSGAAVPSSSSAAEQGGTPSGQGANAGAGAGAAAVPLQPTGTGTTAATVSRVRALYDFVPSEDGELEFKKGDVIAVLESVYKDWWRGSLKGKTGIFPLNYVEKLADPTPDELQREAQMEAEVFSEIKNVEKLLTLLSTSSKDEDSEEIAKLYQQTSAIRPKLIKLIEKYSQKKDDFTQLNEKFIKARRDYEALLETSMSHPPQPSYHQYAVRPQGYGGNQAPYPPQGPPQQDPQRFYPPGPHPDQYPPSSPSPHLQRPGGTPGPGGTQAPFYVVGAEVPSQGGAHPNQNFPPRDQGQRIPSAGKQPARLQTQQPSSPPPTSAPYAAYSQPPAQQGSYGNPQELSTSAYDSPVASHPHPNPLGSNAPFAPSAYSTEERYGTPSAAPAPLNHAGGQQQPYQYNSYQNQPPSQPANSQPQQGGMYSGQGYNDSSDAISTAPPQPTSAAPPPPVPGSQRVHSPVYGGPPGAADSRFSLPSRMAPGAPSAPPGPRPSSPGEQPQYKAYVPPGSSGPSAPSAPSVPADYYRQPGGSANY
ncbi:hypothetical protein PpBr36_08715 [Pyricularia pennisetigena]|uniref:hypothetical protein n=1 Tax=Pyricularia pennisetigena TaxID=1578925 RepID=UPI001153F87F|nr:hypothetical protein PpBr36_08715 [Pyricularia pennisetigena]TLS24463.1 hypothetical protein PpBr36_08715 [Pyricularia pennisetigena]